MFGVYFVLIVSNTRIFTYRTSHPKVFYKKEQPQKILQNPQAQENTLFQ